MPEEREEAVKAYKELEKFGLPPLEELEEEFEVRIYEPVISSAARAVLDRLSLCAGAIDSITHPTHPADIIKSKFYSEEQKREFWEIYKELQAIVAAVMHSAFVSRKARCDALKAAFDAYSGMKEKMQELFSVQVKGWKSPDKVEEAERYFG